METTSLVHFMDPCQKTMAICGAGYLWPSSIALRTELEQVSCEPCRVKHAARLKRNGVV